MFKTLIHPSDRDGCGFYRIHQPATAMSEARPLHFVLSHHYYDIASLKKHNIDKVVVQRHTEPSMITRLEYYKTLNMNIVHDLDDLLWQVPSTNPYNRYFKGINKKMLHRALSIADSLVVSTEPLADQTYKFVRRRAKVLPNLVSNKHFQSPKERTRKKLRVGWAGSNTHVGDLRIISQLISATIDRYDWVFMGYCDPAWLDKVEFHNFSPISDYMNKLKALDLDAMVIPLEQNLFNESKSHIKLLELSSIGVPCITTDISPYSENPNPKIKTSNKSWKNFMEVLESWEDEAVRLSAAKSAYIWAKTYCLESNVPLIQEAWGLDKPTLLQPLINTQNATKQYNLIT